MLDSLFRHRKQATVDFLASNDALQYPLIYWHGQGGRDIRSTYHVDGKAKIHQQWLLATDVIEGLLDKYEGTLDKSNWLR